MAKPSPEELRQRNLVGINRETVTNVTSKDIPGHYPGEDHSWNIDHFRENFHIQFHRNQQFDAVFSFIGIDAAVANAVRRVLLAEIPLLAIEDVFINQNTSIIQDEVLAQRLGLIPLRGNKEGLKWFRWRKKPTEDAPEQDGIADFNTVVIKLQVACRWAKDGMAKARKGETDPTVLYENAHIYARDLIFEPVGMQAEQYFTESAGPITPVNPNILLAKLRPGQSIDIEMHAILGIGSDHAKFSPVATASYRLLPVINIQRPILGEDAKKFARCFPRGVIGLEEVTKKEAAKKGSGYEGHEGEKKAVVKNAMADTVSRECLRHEEFEGKVKLGRQRDHFIFSVESTGQWDSDELVIEAMRILKYKCTRLLNNLEDLREYG